MPSASDAICAKTVFVPCPISVLAASTLIRPSAVASQPTTDWRYFSPEPVKPAPCMNEAKPMPRFKRAPAFSRANRSRLAW
jgi:hypothetical protein